MVKVVLIEPTDKNMENGIQLLYKQRYPELSESTDKFAVLEINSKWKNYDNPTIVQKIIKIEQGDKEIDLWNNLHIPKKVTSCDANVAIHCIKRCSTERLKK